VNKADQFLFVEKYRPHRISETILTDSLRVQFQSFVDSGNIPNLILAGSSGTGKTSCAKAMVEEIGSTYHVINASLNGNIDTLRTEIMNFSSSVSIDGKRKYVILDEADHLNPSSFQPALRAFMEEFASVTSFIMTCNYKNRIIQPLHSRCTVIDFRFSKDDFKSVAKQIYDRLMSILDVENIKYDKKVLVEFIKRHYPDMRKMLGELQTYGQSTGIIDVGILARFTEERLKTLIDHMKSKNFTKVREWINENSDLNTSEIYKKFYDLSHMFVTSESIPSLVLTLAKYQYQASLVADQDINNAACFAELMLDVEWKS